MDKISQIVATHVVRIINHVVPLWTGMIVLLRIYLYVIITINSIIYNKRMTNIIIINMSQTSHLSYHIKHIVEHILPYTYKYLIINMS